MALQETRAIQNKIFYDDCYDDSREQTFSFYLGNNPTLFQEFSQVLTHNEMQLIVEHFWNYTLDPREFEFNFKRAVREAMPHYLNMKAIEFKKDLFDVITNETVRHYIGKEITKLSSDRTGETHSGRAGTNDNKTADKQLPMESQGTTYDGLFNWANGGSSINQGKQETSETINASDKQFLRDNGNRDNDDFETFTETKGLMVDKINKIWQYLIKPKAIEYLFGELSVAFNLVY